MDSKEEILRVFRSGKSAYLILACGHWIKWMSPLPPKKGTEMVCPECNLPKVVT